MPTPFVRLTWLYPADADVADAERRLTWLENHGFLGVEHANGAIRYLTALRPLKGSLNDAAAWARKWWPDALPIVEVAREGVPVGVSSRTA